MSTAANVALEKQSIRSGFARSRGACGAPRSWTIPPAFADRVAFARGTGLDVQCAWPKVLVRKS